MTEESLTNLSASPLTDVGSSPVLTSSIRLLIVTNSLLTSSGRVILRAARSSFHPFLLIHAETLWRETPTRSAISATSLPPT